MIRSVYSPVDRCEVPGFTGLRVLHMPIVLGDPKTFPDFISNWSPVLEACVRAAPKHAGEVCYLTIDEKAVEKSKTMRRPGLHVDGYWKTEGTGWLGGGWGGGGGGGGTWGGRGDKKWDEGTGLLTLSNPQGCRAWNQDFQGEPNPEGDCEHFRSQCGDGEVLRSNLLYWMSPSCVHESLPMTQATKRQFMRLSLPSKADWYEGCTPNPMGVRPTGAIKPRRRFVS